MIKLNINKVLIKNTIALAIIYALTIDIPSSIAAVGNVGGAPTYNFPTTYSGNLSIDISNYPDPIETTININKNGLTFTDHDINVSSKTGHGLKINSANNTIFKESVNSFGNSDKGIYLDKTNNVIFEKDITSSNNTNEGIIIGGSNDVTLKGNVKAENNQLSGIYLDNSQNTNFQQDITLTKNDFSIINKSEVNLNNVTSNDSKLLIDDSTVDIFGKAKLKEIQLNNNSILNAQSGSNIDSPVEGSNKNPGSIKYLGSPISQDIGANNALKKVTFTSQKDKKSQVKDSITNVRGDRTLAAHFHSYL